MFVRLMKFGINVPLNSMQSKMRVSYTQCHMPMVRCIVYFFIFNYSHSHSYSHFIKCLLTVFCFCRRESVGYQQFISYSKPFNIPKRRQQRGSSCCCWLSISAFGSSWSIQKYYTKCECDETNNLRNIKLNWISLIPSSLLFAQCGENCAKSCFSKDPSIECYILDNHGYVVVTKDLDDTGKFFGEINGRLMQSLVSENIYEEVNITDYQGVCNADTNGGNPANILQTVSVRMEYKK